LPQTQHFESSQFAASQLPKSQHTFEEVSEFSENAQHGGGMPVATGMDDVGSVVQSFFNSTINSG
jgi:hypothetical protein